jgi:hypothetical protein
VGQVCGFHQEQREELPVDVQRMLAFGRLAAVLLFDVSSSTSSFFFLRICMHASRRHLQQERATWSFLSSSFLYLSFEEPISYAVLPTFENWLDDDGTMNFLLQKTGISHMGGKSMIRYTFFHVPLSSLSLHPSLVPHSPLIWILPRNDLPSTITKSHALDLDVLLLHFQSCYTM